jgi:cytochrome oxidase assembly protein ShyY1
VLWLLAPRWLLLHLVTVAAVAFMVVLGQWQMQAYVERDERDRQAAAAAAADAVPEPLDGLLAPGEPLTEPVVSRAVVTDGRYDATATLLLPARELDGRTGWYVVTPLLADGSATPVLRGWVATDDDAASTPPQGEVTVTGIVAPLENDRDAAVDPRQALPAGQTAALTTPTLFREYPYPPGSIRQAIVVATSETPPPAAAPERVPVAQAAPQPVGVSSWRHLSYAWQWWLFAAAAIVFWGAIVRAGARERRAATGQLTPEEAPASHQGLP